MRQIAIMVLAILTNAVQAQKNLKPGSMSFESRWMKDQTYRMKWLSMQDSTALEIGEVTTQITSDKKRLTSITQVALNNAKATWIDTTIAEIHSLKPVYHSSYNGQRDMALHFGKIVTGFYNDKIKQRRLAISDTTTEDYFDSNFYPTLIGWLPLKDGYSQNVSIYDYNPSGKKGVIKAQIKYVSSGIYETNKSGPRAVWVVVVSDEISGGENNHVVYYFDKVDRRLWRQEMSVGGRKMMMVLIEQ
ncbi:MAG: hypothetical protein EOP48_04620 [Sphingobacteriales bacterium]|nr:MAG: hypothetical protein EOP48_04620 [Sphingobacteriales bacterium]